MKTKTIYRYLIGIITCIICMFGINEVFAFGPSSDKIYKGIDISEWQGDVDFEEVKRAGIDIVYIKSSEGTNYIDRCFESNYQKARQSGLKIGFYHFVTARSISEAEEEARFFARVISSKQVDCRLAMDFESFGNLSVYEINSISEAFLATVEEVTGIDAVIYSDASNARDVFYRNLTVYPIWVADYFVEEPENNGKWESWVGFQYTDREYVSGISGRVDGDEFTNGILLDSSVNLPESPNKPNSQVGVEYVVKPGDTLSYIAMLYDTTVEAIVIQNNIQNPNLIYPGEVLKITYANNETKNEEYIVKPGDTLTYIARLYGATVESIVQENNIQNPNLIYPGQVLNIPTLVYDRYDIKHTIYRVKAGDTLSQIALEYNTTVENIASINDIQNVNLIYVGEVLRI